jgi:hypothetical protein
MYRNRKGGSTDVLLLGLNLKHAVETGTLQLDDDFTMKSERLETHSENQIYHLPLLENSK